jgi:hypothetical protein
VGAVIAGIKAPPADDAAVNTFAFARMASPGDDPDAAILDQSWQWQAALMAVDAVKGRDTDPELMWP